MRLILQPIKPRKNILDYRLYNYEIREAIDELGDIAESELDKVVANWTHAPAFAKRLTVRADTITVDVRATGDNARIWRYVDEGTRPHLIAPRRARALRFQTGYTPRTTARPSYGGPGQSSGPVVFAQSVRHPGNAARGFAKLVLKEIEPLFKAAIRDAIREAQR